MTPVSRLITVILRPRTNTLAMNKVYSWQACQVSDANSHHHQASLQRVTKVEQMGNNKELRDYVQTNNNNKIPIWYHYKWEIEGSVLHHPKALWI